MPASDRIQLYESVSSDSVLAAVEPPDLLDAVPPQLQRLQAGHVDPLDVV